MALNSRVTVGHLQVVGLGHCFVLSASLLLAGPLLIHGFEERLMLLKLIRRGRLTYVLMIQVPLALMLR